MFKKILLVPKVGGPNVNIANELVKDIQKYWRGPIEFIFSVDEADDETIAIPIGGDGTVLYCAKMVIDKNIPIIGINLGYVGFLTDTPSPYREVCDLLNRLVSYMHKSDNYKGFKKDERTLLSVVVDGKEFVALNDFVISDMYSDQIIDYELSVGGQGAGRHKANSVIVSTPTGSTAYAMFVGGAIIEPDLDVLEIIPVASMSMFSRPIIVSGKNEIQIKVKAKEGRQVALKADGITCEVLTSDSIITIKRHEKKITLLHDDDWNFFNKLTDKLNWNR